MHQLRITGTEKTVMVSNPLPSANLSAPGAEEAVNDSAAQVTKDWIAILRCLHLCVNHLLSITQRLRVRGAQASVPEAPLGLYGQGDRSGLSAVQLWQFELVIDVKTTLSQTKAGRQSHVLPSLCLPLFATLHVLEFSYFTVYTTHACPCRLLKRPR